MDDYSWQNRIELLQRSTMLVFSILVLVHIEFEFVPTAKLCKPGNFNSRNIVHNDICLVKIGVIKIGLRMYIEEREQCRAMTRHRP